MTTPTLVDRVKQMETFARGLTESGSESDRLRAMGDSIIADVRELERALQSARRAIGDHVAPDHCYATGPLTGDPIADFVQCPACAFIAEHDAILTTCTKEPT